MWGLESQMKDLRAENIRLKAILSDILKAVSTSEHNDCCGGYNGACIVGKVIAALDKQSK